MSWILHISDPHLGDVPGQELDDEKDRLAGQPDLETTQTVFLRTLRTIDRYVDANGKPAHVIISGDITYQANGSGFKAFEALLTDHVDILPEDAANIIVVPGNHDVVWDQPPASHKRYAPFLAATRPLGCTTPLIDGIDFDEKTANQTAEAAKYPHLATSEQALVIPLNSSNYCGISVTPANGWDRDRWLAALAPLGDDEMLRQLRKLVQQDVARISRTQVEALGQLLENAGLPPAEDDPRLRIAVLHHQLLPLSTREERKAFESLISLGMLRQLLYEHRIALVLHGHKHESSLYWHTIGSPDGNLAAPQHRCLVISSPGRFDISRPTMRAIVFEGPSLARNLRIVTFGGASPSRRRNPEILDEQTVQIWQSAMQAEPRPLTSIAARDAHTAYARIKAFFQAGLEKPTQNLLCQVDSPAATEGLPPDYPPVPGGDEWLTELVDWWQRPRSELVDRELTPFNHGERIRRRWGDQVARAIRMLDEREDSSRALLELISPRETGRYPDDERDLDDGSYPALVLVEFAIIERDGQRTLDCYAFFRKQEMQYWWTVNVAELARLQEHVRTTLKDPPATGRIVTFTALAHWAAKLPSVAVPVIDLLIEDPERLWELAVALASPDRATLRARADWHRVLSDLQGVGREEPPRPAVGARLLAEHVHRLASVATFPELQSVEATLEALCQEYDVLENTPKLNAAAVLKLRALAKTLADAVQAAIAEPSA